MAEAGEPPPEPVELDPEPPDPQAANVRAAAAENAIEPTIRRVRRFRDTGNTFQRATGVIITVLRGYASSPDNFSVL
jgi:hypothetical protein